MSLGRNPTPELRSAPLRLVVRPDLGGSVAGFWHRDLPIWRSDAGGSLTDVADSACFPLLPYSNRIGLRRFRWLGRDYELRPNFAGSPHTLHGVGWQRPWDVVAQEPGSLTLELRHDADDDWPFSFAARQGFALTPQALTLTLDITNTDRVAQPMGLGWHPYFTNCGTARLQIDVTHRWECDATLLPTRRVVQPAIDARVDELEFDNAFDGWRSPALVHDGPLRMRLTSSLDRVVLYTPRGADAFCVEPVSHVNNAIQSEEPAARGIIALEPGASTSAWLRVDVDAHVE